MFSSHLFCFRVISLTIILLSLSLSVNSTCANVIVDSMLRLEIKFYVILVQNCDVLCER